MKFKNDHLNELLGIPNNSVEVSKRYIDISRQSGKTYQMIMSLPENKNIAILIHSYFYKKYLISEIQKLRPNFNIEKIEFIPIYNKKMIDITEELMLIPDKIDIFDIFIDNAVWDIILLNQIKRLEELAEIFVKE